MKKRAFLGVILVCCILSSCGQNEVEENHEVEENQVVNVEKNNIEETTEEVPEVDSMDDSIPDGENSDSPEDTTQTPETSSGEVLEKKMSDSMGDNLPEDTE